MPRDEKLYPKTKYTAYLPGISITNHADFGGSILRGLVLLGGLGTCHPLSKCTYQPDVVGTTFLQQPIIG